MDDATAPQELDAAGPDPAGPAAPPAPELAAQAELGADTAAAEAAGDGEAAAPADPPPAPTDPDELALRAEEPALRAHAERLIARRDVAAGLARLLAGLEEAEAGRAAAVEALARLPADDQALIDGCAFPADVYPDGLAPLRAAGAAGIARLDVLASVAASWAATLDQAKPGRTVDQVLAWLRVERDRRRAIELALARSLAEQLARSGREIAEERAKEREAERERRAARAEREAQQAKARAAKECEALAGQLAELRAKRDSFAGARGPAADHLRRGISGEIARVQREIDRRTS